MNTDREFSTIRASRWTPAWMAAAIILLGLACVRPVVRMPEAPPPPEKARLEALIDFYVQVKEKQEETVPLEVFRESMLISVNLWEAYALSVVDREELTKLASIDQEAAAARQAAVEVERDKAKRDRWIWGAVGLVVGLLAGGVGIGLASM